MNARFDWTFAGVMSASGIMAVLMSVGAYDLGRLIVRAFL